MDCEASARPGRSCLSQEHILVSSRRRGLSVEDYELRRHGLKRRILWQLSCDVRLLERGCISAVPGRGDPNFVEAHMGGQGRHI